MVAVGTIVAGHPTADSFGSWLLLRWHLLTLGMDKKLGSAC
jgi:hypothetical protein